jgi:two-component system chemotaxis response regulator CheY
MRFNCATDSPGGFSGAKFRGFMADTSLNDLTVLIIEDNESALGPLMHMVRDFGVRSVITTDDRDDGITIVRDKPVDMIISDYGNGRLNGLEFVRRLRRGEEGPHRVIPIIMLAAPEEQAMAHQVSEIGINEFLCKPVSPSSLYSRMLAIATRTREFVDTAAYTGPDRRETPREPEVDEIEDDEIDAETMPCAAAAPELAPSKAFLQSAHHDVEAIVRAYDEAIENPGGRRQAVRLIGTLADIIGGQGRRSGYPLMSEIAELLCDYCRDAPEPTIRQLEFIKAHADAMAAVVDDDLSGEGAAIGKALVSLLRVSAKPQDDGTRPLGLRRRAGLTGSGLSGGGLSGGGLSSAAALVTPV